MTVTLYHTDSPANSLSKDLSSESSLTTAVLRDDVDLLRPRLRIQQTVTLEAYNYLYLPAFDRYYWILDIEVDRTGLSVLICEVDPLVSHRSQILACKAVFDRTANAVNANVDLTDSMIRLEADRLTEYIGFDRGLSYPERIIMVCNV